ncbi:hypothetical protein [Mucilaginibacter lappiensis]|uniref:DUF4251 domain-containing protein n=1 Tax=Mucilaginibacter lappiensis TaxID=354630 RepID=A0A841JKL6_9SPHI|nr:hypothetical protein [Mucilaginibacter lappiensis]MBB6131497.1 hypothetical protein [Mucilaginibacter lappiensis]
MKKIFFVAAFLLLSHFSFSQQLLNDSTFVSYKGISFKVKDDIIIGYPSGQTGDFSFVVNDTKRKFGLLSKIAGAAGDVGSGVATVGIGGGSTGAIKTGLNTMGASQAAGGVGSAGEILLTGENKLTGQQMRILKFSKTGSDKRGVHFFAIVAGPGNSNYKIELEPAITSYEIAGLNHKLFDKPVQSVSSPNSN